MLGIPVYAQTLVSITLLPPTTGYEILTNTSTAQITPSCYWSDGSTTNCSSITLTWGSTNTNDFTVSSSGLVTGAGGTAVPGDYPTCTHTMAPSLDITASTS